MTKYLTATQAGETFKPKKTKAWICRCASNGRIKGATRFGHAWLIPSNFSIEKLVSPHIKS